MPKWQGRLAEATADANDWQCESTLMAARSASGPYQLANLHDSRIHSTTTLHKNLGEPETEQNM